MTVAWRGYWVASPTPFTARGALDLTAAAALFRLYLDQGVHGLVVNGSTGEWCSQSAEERRQVAEIAVEQAAGQIPVVIGASAYVPEDCVELARHGEEIGADGVMITPPPYYHLTEDEIFHFYRTINDRISLPMMVYNWPRGIGVDMSSDLLVRLAGLSQVVAVKESSGNDEKSQSVYQRLAIESPSVRFFARFIHPAGAEFLRNFGGDGNIDGGGLGAPYAVAFYNAWFAGDRELMDHNSVAYSQLSSNLINADYSGRFASAIAQLKACMRLLEQPGGFVRPPLMELEDQGVLVELASILASSGISKTARMA